MTTPVELAVCGSNASGDVPFSVALRLGARLVTAQSAPGVRGDLAALVAGVCEQAGVAPADVRAVRVDVGPGSYTGLRVVVTFVRFLQQFGGVTVQALDTLALLAARAPAAATANVLAVLDARRDRLHAQSFAVGPAGVTARGAAAALPLQEVLALLPQHGLVVVPATLPAPLQAALQGAGATLHPVQGIVAAELFAAGLPLRPAGSAELEPRYLMASYAEG